MTTGVTLSVSRESNCRRLMTVVSWTPEIEAVRPVLSYPALEKIPFVANCVEINNSTSFPVKRARLSCSVAPTIATRPCRVFINTNARQPIWFKLNLLIRETYWHVRICQRGQIERRRLENSPRLIVWPEWTIKDMIRLRVRWLASVWVLKIPSSSIKCWAKRPINISLESWSIYQSFVCLPCQLAGIWRCFWRQRIVVKNISIGVMECIHTDSFSMIPVCRIWFSQHTKAAYRVISALIAFEPFFSSKWFSVLKKNFFRLPWPWNSICNAIFYIFIAFFHAL